MYLSRLTLVLCLLSFEGCRAAPEMEGKSLACKPGCPEGMRCYEGVCIFNSPPVITVEDALLAPPGLPLAILATATDLDGDAIAFSWTQTAGSPLFSGAVAGGQLEVVPPADGDYLLVVEAEDELGAVTAVEVAIEVENHAPTLAMATAQSIPVGVPAALDPLVEDVDGHVLAATWQQLEGQALSFSPGASAVGTTVTAPQAGTYAVRVTVTDGFVEVSRDLLLVAAAVPVVYADPASTAGAGCGDVSAPCPSVTAAISSQPGTEHVVVLAARGGHDECLSSFGNIVITGGFEPETWRFAPDELGAESRILCNNASGHTLSGTLAIRHLVLASTVTDHTGEALTVAASGSTDLEDVRIEVPSCGPSCDAVGVSLVGGTLRLRDTQVVSATEGFASVRTVTGLAVVGGDVELGSGSQLVLSAPATQRAIGVRARDTVLVLDGAEVKGGIAPELVGLELLGGAATLQGATLDLVGVGATTLIGLRAQTCTDCVCGVAGCQEPDLTVTDSEIAITSQASDSGPLPCAGVGVAVIAAGGEQVLSGGAVTVARPFARAVGVALLGVDASLTGTQVTVDGGRESFQCLFSPAVVPLPQGIAVAGVLLSGGAPEVRDTAVAVGGHDAYAAGIIAGGVAGATVTGNEVVAAASAELPGLLTIGGLFASGASGLSPGAGTSELARNTFAGGPYTRVGAGLVIDGDGWEVANNFVYGGDGVHAIGLLLAHSQDSPEAAIVHNTFHGGGLLGATRTSRALVSDAKNKVTAWGTLGNNLFDAGMGLGRRYLVDNDIAPDVVLTGNLAQRAALAPHPGPGHVVVAPETRNATSFPWNVVTAGSAELVRVGSGNLLHELHAEPLFGLPGATWSGAIDLGPALVSDIGGRVVLALFAEGAATTIATFSLRDAAGIERAPEQIAMGKLDEVFPNDIGFLEDGKLYWMRANLLSLGYEPPVLFPAALDAPLFLARSPGRGSLVVLDDAQDGGPRLVEAQSGAFIDVSSLVSGEVTGFELASLRELGLNGADDAVFIAGGAVVVLRDLDFASDSLPVPAPLTTAACLGAAPLFTQTGRSQKLGDSLLLVQCDDGSLEVFTLQFNIALQLVLNLRGTTDLGAGVTSWRWLADGAIHDYLLVTRDDDTLELRTFDDTTDTFVVQDSLTLVADVAMRDLTDPAAPVLLPDFSLLGPDEVELLGTPCGLAASLASPFDLHRTSSSDACADAGLDLGPLAVPDDFDAATRTTAPDVGADERP